LYLSVPDDRCDLHRRQRREQDALAMVARRDDQVLRADGIDDGLPV